MKFEPFTLYEAKVVSHSFQHLVGRQIKCGESGNDIIEHVAVTPFDDINKWMFIYFYKDCKDVRKALEHYQGPFYDVLLLTSLNTENNMFIYPDLRTYLSTNNIRFDLKAILEKNFMLNNE